jgi:hypothetical protein
VIDELAHLAQGISSQPSIGSSVCFVRLRARYVRSNGLSFVQIGPHLASSSGELVPTTKQTPRQTDRHTVRFVMLNHLILVQSVLAVAVGGITAIMTALYYLDLVPCCCRDNAQVTEWLLHFERLYLVGHMIDVFINWLLLYGLPRSRTVTLLGFGHPTSRLMDTVHHVIVVIGLVYLQYWGSALAEWSRFIIGISLLETPTVCVAVRVLLGHLRARTTIQLSSSLSPLRFSVFSLNGQRTPSASEQGVVSTLPGRERVLHERVRLYDRLLLANDFVQVLVFGVTRTLVLMFHLVPLWMQMPLLLDTWVSRISVWILFNGLGLVNGYYCYRLWLHARKQRTLLQKHASGDGRYVLTHYSMEDLAKQTIAWGWEQIRQGL